MLKGKEKLIVRLLMLSMCVSLLPTKVAFAVETTESKVNNTIQAIGSAVTVSELKVTQTVVRTALNNEISNAKLNAKVPVGNSIGECPQSAINALYKAITAAQAVANNSKATQTDVNNAVKALQQAEQAFFKAIITGLKSNPISVAPSTNFDQVIQVEIQGCGDFVKSLSAKNIILGGDFKGLTIKSASIVDSNHTWIANIRLSGNLKKTTGNGIITVNSAGWTGPSGGHNLTVVIPIKQVDKTILSNEISEAKMATEIPVGNTIGKCPQSAMNALIKALSAAQAVANNNKVTQTDVNNAVKALQKAEDLFYKSVITGLISNTSYVSASTNFDKTIQVRIEGCGDFIKSLNAKNVILGGDFKGLTIKSASIADSNHTWIANIRLSGILKKSTGIGTIAVNSGGWNGPSSGHNITCSFTVKN